jgi:hypothetical protein
MIPDYVYDEAAQINDDGQRLTKAREDIPLIKAEIQRHQEMLDGAERLTAALTVSLPLRQRALELLCLDQGWPFPPPPQSHADPSTTQAEGFATVQVAKPVMQHGSLVCDWASCGMELIGSDTEGWLHAETGREECKPEPPAPALQDGTDGSPLLTTVLPPHGVEVPHGDA